MLEPTQAETIAAAIDARLLGLHTSRPGRIVSYDKTKQVADVQPCIDDSLEKQDGDFLNERLPVIPNVPVAFPRGGGFRIIWDLVAGDHVWLVFSEVATAQWRTTGKQSLPGDLRRHDLSYPIAIPGAAPMTDPLDPPGTGEAVVDFTGATIRIGGALADYVALATKVSVELAKITAWAALVNGALNGLGAPVAALAAFSSTASSKVKVE